MEDGRGTYVVLMATSNMKWLKMCHSQNSRMKAKPENLQKSKGA